MQGANGASHGVGRLLGVHEGGVHHIGGDTSREQLGHRRGDIQFHRVVEVAAAHGVGDDRELVALAILQHVGTLATRAFGAVLVAGALAHEHAVLGDHEFLGADEQHAQLHRGIFGNLFDLPQRELRREPHARGPELASDSQREPVGNGHMGADIEQRPLFGSPFHSTEAFGQKRLALSSILPHVGIDDRFARAANGLVIGHRHDGNAALGVAGLLGSGVLLAGDNRLAAPVVQSRHVDEVRAGAHLIYVPALNYRRGEAVIAGQKNAAAEQAGYPKGCIPIMPVADHEAVGGAREAVVDADVWKYAAEGKPLLAESLGAMERASEEGALLDVGSHVPITNGLSLAVASEFGAARVWLSPELTLRQIEEVAKDAPVELGVLLIGAQELMVTEHCMLMSQGPCDENCAECPRRKSPHVLKDRKGYEFPVVTDAMGRSHLYNAVELDIASSMPELLAAGISSYMVDATLMNAEETAHAVGRAIRALHVAQNDGNAIAKMPNTTSGHLYRGVS